MTANPHPFTVHVHTDPDDPRGNWERMAAATQLVHTHGGGTVHLSPGLYQPPAAITAPDDVTFIGGTEP